MKKNFSKILALLLAVLMLASQMMIPASAVDTSENCSCNPDERTGERIYSVEPTCVEYGVDIYLCDECGLQWAEYTGSPKAEHTEIIPVAAKSATCTEIGWEAYEYCTACSYTTYVEIPAKGHFTIAEGAKEPTCTENGHTAGREYCIVCKKYVKYAEIIPATGHTEEEIPAVEATCTEDGSTAGVKCSVCDEVLEAPEVVPAHGHDGIPTEGKVSATCIEGAYVVYKCSICEEYYKVYDPNDGAKGHTYPTASVVENTVDPTCTEDGSHDEVEYCTVCDVELSRTSVVDPALGHDELFDVIAPTCSEPGITKVTCSRCDYYDERDPKPVDTSAHTPIVTKPHKDATCSAEGNTAEVSCADCEKVLTSSKVIAINPDAHKEKAAVKENVVNATCTESGSYDLVVRCEYCDEVLSSEHKTTTKLGHRNNITLPAVPATCTEDGLTAGKKCSRCNEITTPQNIVPALGHDDTDVVKVENEVAVTCTTDGSYDEVLYCKRAECGAELSRDTIIVRALGHDDTDAITIENEVAATCVADGSYDEVLYCKRAECKEELSRDTIIVPALKHDYGTEPIEIYNSDICSEDEYEVYLCKVCEFEYTHITRAAHDHDVVVDPAVPATCTETGLTEGTHCSVCDLKEYEDILVPQEVVPATGHDEEVFDPVEPTCTEEGHTGYKVCKTCGEITQFASRIPATGHTEEDIPGYAPTFDEPGLTDGKVCSVCGEELYPQKALAPLSEYVTFTYKATGLNASTTTVNSGYVVFEVAMEVTSDIARLYAFDLVYNYDSSALELVGVECGDADDDTNDAFDLVDYYVPAEGTVNLSPNMGLNAEGVVLEKGNYVVATLTFKVNNGFVGNTAISLNSGAFTRDEYANTMFVDFGTGESIEVVKLADANGDGVIDSKDTLAMSKWILEPTSDYEVIYDLDKNGFIDGDDFWLMRNAAVGNEEYLNK